MFFLKKIFKLPTPIELGWSEYNALEDELFSDEPVGKTWQDWHRTVKRMHPIKYWITETLTDFINYKIWLRIKRPIIDFHYWFVSHVIPSKKYHMLDLRQPCNNGNIKNLDCYRYGWLDVPERMLYAMFNLLGEYLNKEKPTDLTKWHTIEEINANEHLKIQHDTLEEAKAIYYWWSVERNNENDNYNKLLDNLNKSRKDKSLNKKLCFELVQRYKEFQDNKTEEMILRLLKIRTSLWT